MIFLAVRVCETNRAADRVAQIDLPFDHVVPVRRVRVFKVRHENLRARIKRVDHHLAIGRPGDLDAAVLDVRRNRRAGPVAFPNRFCFRQKIEGFAAVERRLSILPALQTFFPAIAESALQLRNKSKRIRSKDFGKSRRDRAE